MANVAEPTLTVAARTAPQLMTIIATVDAEVLPAMRMNRQHSQNVRT